jgi:glycosyltransferase involved in cell wall biosynthesis
MSAHNETLEKERGVNAPARPGPAPTAPSAPPALTTWLPAARAPAVPKRRMGLLIATLQSGGAERVCSLLANHWAQRGHSVQLMTLADPSSDAYEIDPAVQRVVIGDFSLSPNLLSALRKNMRRVQNLRAHLKQSQLDVALSFMNVSNSLLAVAGLGTGTVCVGSERSYPPAEGAPLAHNMARWALYGCLDAVVAQTAQTATWLRQATLARNVAAIPNPITLPLPTSQPTVQPQQWLQAGRPVLLAVGRLVELKRFDALLHAFAQATADARQAHATAGPSNTAAPWQLAILGEGPLHASLKAQVDELGLQDHVVLPGRVGNVSDWFALADAYVLTSRYEGYPNALLEALASGVPSIACDVLTGPRDLIVDGVNGLLVPANSHEDLTNALRRMMGDAALRQRMASQASLTLESHAMHTIAARWEAVFEQALVAKRVA